MGHPIRIIAEGHTLAAELNDSPTAAAVLAALPLEGLTTGYRTDGRHLRHACGDLRCSRSQVPEEGAHETAQ